MKGYGTSGFSLVEDKLVSGENPRFLIAIYIVKAASHAELPLAQAVPLSIGLGWPPVASPCLPPRAEPILFQTLGTESPADTGQAVSVAARPHLCF